MNDIQAREAQKAEILELSGVSYVEAFKVTENSVEQFLGCRHYQ